ncbi:DUF456 domain-containing protein [Actinomyces haliotis]|uniref:DUF456 domain-containing protein n=1 Tax=Actinomyces haliotis TaxID=1280843 RepID=UPI00188F8BD5|nr:DUF456 domain-containing protein [Actinomyces haliotis]
MGTLGTVIVGLVILVGLGGALTQLYPGPLVVLAAVAVWAVVTGGPWGWGVLAVSALAIAGTAVGKYLLMGRHLKGAGVPGTSMLVGGIFGILGFFVVPVVGLPLGFTLGVYLWETARQGSERAGRSAAWAAVKAQGLAILLELAGCLVATAAWGAGLIWG